MRVLLAAVALSVVLGAAPTFAQAQGQQPPATPPPQSQPAPAPRPFPEGAKVAYIDIQRIANQSAEGKAATAKVQALVQKKQAEAAERQKALQADQQKLQSGGSVLSEQARAELEKKIERTNIELQRMAQDAQQEVADLQQQLQADFQRKLMPVVQQVSEEKGIQLLFSAGDSGLVWADTGLDITADVIERFDSGDTASAKPPVN